MFSNVYQSLLTFEPGGRRRNRTRPRAAASSARSCSTYRCELRRRPDLPQRPQDDRRGRQVLLRPRQEDQGGRRPSRPCSPASTPIVTKGRTVTFHLLGPDATFPFKRGHGRRVDRRPHAVPEGRPAHGRPGRRHRPVRPEVVTKRQSGRADAQRARTRARSRAPAPRSTSATSRSPRRSTGGLEGQAESTSPPASCRPGPLAGLSPSDPGPAGHRGGQRRDPQPRLQRPGRLAPRTTRRSARPSPGSSTASRWSPRSTRAPSSPLYSLIPTGFTGHTTSFFDAYPKPDPTAGQRLLTEAGVGLPVRFTYGYAKGRDAAAAGGRRAEAAAGEGRPVQGHRQGRTSGPTFQKRYAAGKHDAYAVGWVADYPDPDTFSRAARRHREQP